MKELVANAEGVLCARGYDPMMRFALPWVCTLSAFGDLSLCFHSHKTAWS